MSTLHSIKGLEFDRVFLMDVNEGTIPYHKAVSDSSIEEGGGSSLCGMTRARKELYILMQNAGTTRIWKCQDFSRKAGLYRKRRSNGCGKGLGFLRKNRGTDRQSRSKR